MRAFFTAFAYLGLTFNFSFLANASERPNSQGHRYVLGKAPRDFDTVKIVLVGDSTTSQKTGWGGAFCAYQVSEMTACLPIARGGRSTKTYRNEKAWRLVLNELNVKGYQARYVLIEMGHNDKSDQPAVGTNLVDEFPKNLARFVEEARGTGAEVMLVTPLASRHFKDGALADSVAPWAVAVRKVAVRTHAPLIDLNKASAQLYERLGAEGSLAFESREPTSAERQAAIRGTTLLGRVDRSRAVSNDYPEDDPRRYYSADYIHLNENGARQIAHLVGQLLLTAEPALKRFVH